MRHNRGNKKLGKPTDQRLAMLRAIVNALFLYRSIKTTDDRAKEARKIAEKLITLSKKGDLHSRRQALKILPQKDTIKILFNDIAKIFDNKVGGYTKITKLGFRRGDAATISLLELVE